MVHTPKVTYANVPSLRDPRHHHHDPRPPHHPVDDDRHGVHHVPQSDPRIDQHPPSRHPMDHDGRHHIGDHRVHNQPHPDQYPHDPGHLGNPSINTRPRRPEDPLRPLRPQAGTGPRHRDHHSDHHVESSRDHVHVETYPRQHQDHGDSEPWGRPEHHQEHFGSQYHPSYPSSSSEELKYEVVPEQRPKPSTPPRPIPVVTGPPGAPVQVPPAIPVEYPGGYHYPGQHHQPPAMVSTGMVSTDAGQIPVAPRFVRGETYGQSKQSDDTKTTHSYPAQYHG